MDTLAMVVLAVLLLIAGIAGALLTAGGKDKRE